MNQITDYIFSRLLVVCNWLTELDLSTILYILDESAHIMIRQRSLGIVWPWELAGGGGAHQGSHFNHHLLLHRARRLDVINLAGVAEVDYMQRTFFRFMTEFNFIVCISVSILLTILVTHFKVVEMKGSIHPRVRVGVDRFRRVRLSTLRPSGCRRGRAACVLNR